MVLLAGEDVLAVYTPEVLQQRFCICIGVWADGRCGDLVRAALRAGRQDDRVDEVPAPVVLDLDCVGARVEEDLSGGNGCPCCSAGKRDLRAARAVEDDVSVFVAVGAVVDELEIVEL